MPTKKRRVTFDPSPRPSSKATPPPLLLGSLPPIISEKDIKDIINTAICKSILKNTPPCYKTYERWSNTLIDLPPPVQLLSFDILAEETLFNPKNRFAATREQDVKLPEFIYDSSSSESSDDETPPDSPLFDENQNISDTINEDDLFISINVSKRRPFEESVLAEQVNNKLHKDTIDVKLLPSLVEEPLCSIELAPVINKAVSESFDGTPRLLRIDSIEENIIKEDVELLSYEPDVKEVIDSVLVYNDDKVVTQIEESKGNLDLTVPKLEGTEILNESLDRRRVHEADIQLQEYIPLSESELTLNPENIECKRIESITDHVIEIYNLDYTLETRVILDKPSNTIPDQGISKSISEKSEVLNVFNSTPDTNTLVIESTGITLGTSYPPELLREQTLPNITQDYKEKSFTDSQLDTTSVKINTITVPPTTDFSTNLQHTDDRISSEIQIHHANNFNTKINSTETTSNEISTEISSVTAGTKHDLSIGGAPSITIKTIEHTNVTSTPLPIVSPSPVVNHNANENLSITTVTSVSIERSATAEPTNITPTDTTAVTDPSQVKHRRKTGRRGHRKHSHANKTASENLNSNACDTNDSSVNKNSTRADGQAKFRRYLGRMSAKAVSENQNLNCAGEPETLEPHMRDSIKESQCLIWIYNMIDEAARIDFEFFLKDGCILCRLMNRIVPGSIPDDQISEEGARSKQHNMSKFLTEAEKFGVPKAKLFFAEDLLHLRHVPRVTRCIFALAKIAANDPALERLPLLGDEPSFMKQEVKAVVVPGHRDTKDVMAQLLTTSGQEEEAVAPTKARGRKHSLYS